MDHDFTYETTYEKILATYLLDQAKQDANFKDKLNLEWMPECCEYIQEKAEEYNKDNANCLWIDSPIVFKWARDFFNEDIHQKNIEKKSKEEAEAEERRKRYEEAQKNKPADPTPAPKKKEAEQLSMF